MQCRLELVHVLSGSRNITVPTSFQKARARDAEFTGGGTSKLWQALNIDKLRNPYNLLVSGASHGEYWRHCSGLVRDRDWARPNEASARSRCQNAFLRVLRSLLATFILTLRTLLTAFLSALRSLDRLSLSARLPLDRFAPSPHRSFCTKSALLPRGARA